MDNISIIVSEYIESVSIIPAEMGVPGIPGSAGIRGLGVTGSSNAFTDGTVIFSGVNATILSSLQGLSQFIQISAGAGGEVSGVRYTSADSQLQFTSANSLLLGSEAAQNFRLTNNDSQLQFTSANSIFQPAGNYLTTAALSNHTHDNYLNTSQSSLFRHTSQNSQLQYTSAMSNYQSTGNYLTTAMQSNANTSFVGLNSAVTNITATINSSGISISNPGWLTTAMASNQTSNFRYTSADSQLQFTSANSNFQYSSNTSAITANAFPSAQTTKFAGTQTGATNANITVNSNGVSISVNPGGAGDGGNIIAAAGSTAQSTATVIFSNSNGIGFGLNGATLTASHNGLTTAMQSNANTSFVGLNSAVTNITATINSSGISISNPGWLTTAMASNQTSNLRYTSADSQLQFTSANSNLLGSAATQSFVFTANSSLFQHTSATSAITANALNTSQSSLFRHTSQNSQLQYTSDMSNYQSTGNYLTTAMQSNANTSFVGLNSAVTNITATINSSGISISNPGWLTTAMASNQTSNFRYTSADSQLQFTSANSNFPGTGTSATNASITLNSNGLAISVAAPGAVAEANWITLGGNVSGNSSASGSTIQWYGGSNITLSAGGNSVVSIIGPSGGGAVLQGSGTYTQNTGTVQFSNANNVTFGLTAGTMTASVPVGTVAFSDANGITFGSSVNGVSTSISASYNSTQFLTTAMLSNANTSFVGLNSAVTGFTATINSSGISLSNPGWITTAAQSDHSHGNPTLALTNLSGTTASASNGLTLSLSAAAPSGGAVYTDYEWHNFTGNSTHLAPGQNSIWYQPFELRNALSASSIQIGMTFTGTVTSAVTAIYGQTMDFQLLSRNATNSTRFDSIWSNNLTFVMWNSGTSSGSWNYNGTTSSSAASNILITQIMGQRIHSITIGSELSSGFYMMAFKQSTSSANYSALMRTYNPVFVAPLPQAKNFIGAQTATSIGHFIGGPYSVTSAAFPDWVGVSELRKSNDMRLFFKIGAVS